LGCRQTAARRDLLGLEIYLVVRKLRFKIFQGSKQKIFHHSTAVFSPPEGIDVIYWLGNQFSELPGEIPSGTNMEVDGAANVRIYSPGSPQALHMRRFISFGMENYSSSGCSMLTPTKTAHCTII